MYKTVSLKLTKDAIKLYSNAFIHSVYHKYIIPQLNYVTKAHVLVTRGYSTMNPSSQTVIEYNKLYKEQLRKTLEDPQQKAVYEKYKLEIEFLKHKTTRVPEIINDYDWLHLLKSTTKGQRRAYLEFRWKVEMKHKNREIKKQLKKLKMDSSEIKDTDNIYGLNKCTMFFRIRDSIINHFYNSRLINAMLHEPTIVFDCGYEPFMTPYEMQNCVKQLLLSYSVNRVHNDPFNLYFCNVNMDGSIMQRLHRVLPQIHDPDFPLNISTKSYLDIFDKNKLVYLTPHSNTIMTRYDPTLIYIIGALVDKVNPKAMSLQKAKQEGITMMKFPLSEMLDWGVGSAKNLPLNQVLSILLDLRATNNWREALKHIPERKLREGREALLLKKLKYRDNKIERFMSHTTE